MVVCYKIIVQNRRKYVNLQLLIANYLGHSLGSCLVNAVTTAIKNPALRGAIRRANGQGAFLPLRH